MPSLKNTLMFEGSYELWASRVWSRCLRRLFSKTNVFVGAKSDFLDAKSEDVCEFC